jgi:uncharacterized membrane protein YagU involved in acid resistance
VPAREIIDVGAARTGVELKGEAVKNVTLAAHFAYGAACGALLAALNPRMSTRSGAAAGAGIWLASYMGWIPQAGILKPATDHPLRRNAMMIGVHLVWGGVTALAMRELALARETIVADGPAHDAPGVAREALLPRAGRRHASRRA